MLPVSMPPSIADGSVVITQAQQYAELQELRRSIEKLTATVDPALNEIRSDVGDHETRLRVIEARRYVTPTSFAWSIGTAIALLGLLVTFLAVVLAK